MTLRMQFDDLERELQRTLNLGEEREEGFLETVEHAMASKRNYTAAKEELHHLRSAVKQTKKELECLKAKMKKESKILKKEQEKTRALEKETNALENVLEEARSVFQGGNKSRESLLSSMLSAIDTSSVLSN